jgi:hypothetical protein
MTGDSALRILARLYAEYETADNFVKKFALEEDVLPQLRRVLTFAEQNKQWAADNISVIQHYIQRCEQQKM